MIELQKIKADKVMVGSMTTLKIPRKSQPIKMSPIKTLKVIKMRSMNNMMTQLKDQSTRKGENSVARTLPKAER